MYRLRLSERRKSLAAEVRAAFAEPPGQRGAKLCSAPVRFAADSLGLSPSIFQILEFRLEVSLRPGKRRVQ
jgi:hypothetical protein